MIVNLLKLHAINEITIKYRNEPHMIELECKYL